MLKLFFFSPKRLKKKTTQGVRSGSFSGFPTHTPTPTPTHASRSVDSTTNGSSNGNVANGTSTTEVARRAVPQFVPTKIWTGGKEALAS